MAVEVCPTCGSDAHGCTVRDVGAFCRAPSTARPPPVVRVTVPAPTGRGWARISLRPRAASLWPGTPEPEPIVRFLLGPGLLRMPCLLCGVRVAVVPLPTGDRLAVTDATGVVHDVTCKGQN